MQWVLSEYNIDVKDRVLWVIINSSNVAVGLRTSFRVTEPRVFGQQQAKPQDVVMILVPCRAPPVDWNQRRHVTIEQQKQKDCSDPQNDVTKNPMDDYVLLRIFQEIVNRSKEWDVHSKQAIFSYAEVLQTTQNTKQKQRIKERITELECNPWPRVVCASDDRFKDWDRY
jgi:hypothetical protein